MAPLECAGINVLFALGTEVLNFVLGGNSDTFICGYIILYIYRLDQIIIDLNFELFIHVIWLIDTSVALK